MNVRVVERHPLYWNTGEIISYIEQVNEMSNSKKERMVDAIGYLQLNKNKVLGCADWCKGIKKKKCNFF